MNDKAKTNNKHRYYLVMHYNQDGKYCSHTYYSIPEGGHLRKLKQYINIHTDRIIEVTESCFCLAPAFYRQFIKA